MDVVKASMSYLGYVRVEVHLLTDGVLPVVAPAPVLHPVHQADQVLALRLHVVTQRAGIVLRHKHHLHSTPIKLMYNDILRY